MSISNLLSQDIGSITIPCNIIGAITGSSSINLRRYNNIVYITFNVGNGSFFAGQSNITYVPTVPIPSSFAPPSIRFFNVVVSNNGNIENGFLSFNNSMSLFVFIRSAGGNFSGSVLIPNNTITYTI